ncbi:hypothetical protein [Arthrobacter sp. BPSS-3]|uniref:hypothetical protein n=1 Tax=Arthrobacter sp. BPSS-3 TaxID=3366580 RepID=UPI0037DD6207
MSEEKQRQYFLVRAAVQVLCGALMGALMWSLVPDSGALHLLPTGIGLIVSLPLVAAACSTEQKPRPRDD